MNHIRSNFPYILKMAPPYLFRGIVDQRVLWVYNIFITGGYNTSCIMTCWYQGNHGVLVYSGRLVVILDKIECTDNVIIRPMLLSNIMYRKISNIRRTKSQTLNVSRLVLQLSLPNPMKPGVKSRKKM